MPENATSIPETSPMIPALKVQDVPGSDLRGCRQASCSQRPGSTRRHEVGAGEKGLPERIPWR
jgi:hypothetical protein